MIHVSWGCSGTALVGCLPADRNRRFAVFGLVGRVAGTAPFELFLLLLFFGAVAFRALLVVVGLERHCSLLQNARQHGKEGLGFPKPSQQPTMKADQTAFRFSADVLPRFGSRCSS
eukprot:TRINITY_DN77_c1_g1_i1.p1 TRINITY_DN77_c1_g1~~TRINITY_DN77_c1_g1_i1.p1  ORF type:complete len:116 (+),score=6.57 TRINITY_DN77_c1_g1_i1:364-711(+)